MKKVGVWDSRLPETVGGGGGNVSVGGGTTDAVGYGLGGIAAS